VLLEGGRKAVPAAEDLFAESLAWARRQAALSWELRTSVSLARLQRGQGRTQEAHGLLAAVYGRFTEGFETADLLVAKQLLDEPA
jgi:predicted ATPase